MGKTLIRKLAFTIQLIKEGKIGLVWDALLRRFYSEEIALGFKRDLQINYRKPKTLMPVSIRRASVGDEQYFLDRRNDGLINKFETCYVAVNKEGIPCCRLWLIDASQNDALKLVWGNIFPKLKKEEVLIENVYTVPRFRGFGILPAVVDEVLKNGRELGARYALTFGELSNYNTSRAFAYAGFEPYILRRKKWFLFRKNISFDEIPEAVLKDYHKVVAAYKAKPLS